MADLYNYVQTEGVIVPNTEDILSNVQQEYKDIFGEDLSVEESTPQGRLIEMEVASRKGCLSLNALIANMLNPSKAFGSFLDSYGALFDVIRQGALPTVVYCKLSGVPGTIIPSGSQAQDTQGNVYVIAGETTIGEQGFVYVNFSNIKTGAIPCLAGSLNVILTPIQGWEGITNDSIGTLGYDIESDAEYRIKIDKSKTKYSQGAVASIEGELYSIDGLKSYYIYENPDGINKTHADDPRIPEGETSLAHSIFVWVYGANEKGSFYQEVANALVNKKSAGCGYSYVQNGNYVHTITSDNGQIAIFNTAQPLPIYINVSVKNISYQCDNLLSEISSLLQNYFAGNLENQKGIQIGQEISAFELSNIISSNLSVKVDMLTIGTSSSNLSSNPISVPKSQIATVSPQNITITIQ